MERFQFLILQIMIIVEIKCEVLSLVVFCKLIRCSFTFFCHDFVSSHLMLHYLDSVCSCLDCSPTRSMAMWGNACTLQDDIKTLRQELIDGNGLILGFSLAVMAQANHFNVLGYLRCSGSNQFMERCAFVSRGDATWAKPIQLGARIGFGPSSTLNPSILSLLNSPWRQLPGSRASGVMLNTPGWQVFSTEAPERQS